MTEQILYFQSHFNMAKNLTIYYEQTLCLLSMMTYQSLDKTKLVILGRSLLFPRNNSTCFYIARPSQIYECFICIFTLIINMT